MMGIPEPFANSNTSSVMEEDLQEKMAMFRDFLTSREVWGGEREYTVFIREMLKSRRSRLVVNVNDVRQFNRDLATLLLQQPVDFLPCFERALREVAQDLNEPTYAYDIHGIRFKIGLEGSFGELHTTPRHLSSRLLSHMICMDGIVTSCSLVRPKLLKSVHYSESLKTFLVKEYWDATMLNGMQLPGSLSYPTEGDDNQRLSSEFGLSQYRDYQTITIQEMPEKAPAGQLPRSVDVIVDDDLVDQLKPGDRAQIFGVYKSLATAFNGQVPATFRAVLIANHVRHLNRDSVAPQLSPGDVAQIRSLSRRRDIFELLSRSLAPSIYGHEFVKKALALLLLGGVEKNISNSNSEVTGEEEDRSTATHIRGDINLMLIGDPSTAKSQLLRFVLGIAPLAIATTGRGSSGVGLTAAVTSDRETGERRLEAGAMVLADRGIVCIDEFDKMSDTDRVAIHEVMEQQTVTIAKAGIHASLNARCSVLAAANPIWGQYRETASPQENIRLPDSLLSRFDLLFIILDRNTPEHDRNISHHVLKMHRYLAPGCAEGTPVPENDFFDDEEEEDVEKAEGVDGEGSEGKSSSSAASIFQRRYTSEGGDADGEDADRNEDDERNSQILTISFIKKYMHYARSTCVPVLTKSAADLIVAAYTEFRQKKEQAEMDANSTGSGSSAATTSTTAKTFPVTPRTLETLIRLATAHAKARLSSKVEKKDARLAQELVEFCLYQEVKKKPSKRNKKLAIEEDEDEDDDSNNEEESDDHKAPKAASASKPSAIPKRDIWDPELEEISQKIATSAKSRRDAARDAQEASEMEKLSVLEDEKASSESLEAALPIAGSQTQTQSQSQPRQRSRQSQQPLPIVNTLNSSLDSQSQTPSAAFEMFTEEDRLRLSSHLQSTLYNFNQTGSSSVALSELQSAMTRSDPAITAIASTAQLEAILTEMQQENKIYYVDGTIYII